MKTFYRALATAAVVGISAGAAGAATFNLADQTRGSTSSFSVSDDGITMTVTGQGPRGNTVRTDYDYGLSVGDHLIDGYEGTEWALFSFSENVSLGGFYAGYTDRNDNYRLLGWNLVTSAWDYIQTGTLLGGNDTNSSRRFIETTGSAATFVSNLFAIGTVDRHDEFKIRSVTAEAVSEVPLPASGLLLLGALGALGLRRRKA